MFRQKFRFFFGFIMLVLLQINDIKAENSLKSVLSFFNSHDPRIINGTTASLNRTRHQVSIRRRSLDNNFFGTGHICGGSLISDNVVLCAAHCFAKSVNMETKVSFYPDNDFRVVMGNLDRFEYANTLIFDIVKIVKRVEIFDKSTYDNDIVFIILNGTVPAQHPSVRPILLNNCPLENNTVCQATGWGETEDGYPADELMTVDVPLIDSNECREKSNYSSLILEGMICAGYLEGEKDACVGDSGGPLVCEGSQAGIVSWGTGCAKALYPGVYTNVSYYQSWLLKDIAKHNGTLPKLACGVANLRCSFVLICLFVIFNIFLNRICKIN